jgi:hypothetical protein
LYFNTEEPTFNNGIINGIIFDEDTVKCTPKKGEWNGGDEVLMIIPKLDKRKGI